MKIRTMLSALMFAALLALAPVTFAAQGPGQQGPASSLPADLGGSAYTAYLAVPVGSLQPKVGPLLYLTLSCNFASVTKAASAPSESLAPVASTGAVSSHITSTHGSTTAGVTSTTDVRNLNVLAGLITADEVISSAQTTATTSTATSVGVVSFNNLKIAGVAMPSNPKPNQKITLSGLGYVVLDEISGPVNKSSGSHVSVSALDIKVTTSNTFGLAVGIRLVVGQASSSFTRASSAVTVYALGNPMYSAGITGLLSVRPLPEAEVGCLGGSNSASQSSPSLPSLLTAASIHSSASGAVSASGGSATATTTDTGFGFLSGLITIGSITTTASASITNGSGSTSGHTTFTNPMIAGLPAPTNPAPNTVITLPGLGKVVLNEQSLHPGSTSSAASVVGIDIYITQTNLFGLPMGSHIVVSQAKAIVNAY